MTSAALRPPVPYYGGKQTIAEQIVALFPPHLHYIEPFAGSMAVLLVKPPVRMETVNDLDGRLMAFWRVLRDRPQELARVCQLTPHSRTEYEACRGALRAGNLPSGDLETARIVWVCLTQGRGRSLRTRGNGWRYHIAGRGSSIGMPAYLNGYIGRMEAAAERLHSVSLECMPALDLITKYGIDPESLLYVDPPYVGTTRGHGDQYEHEMRDDASHRDLAAALNACRAAVVLSGYPSELYDRELYQHWHRVELCAMTGNGLGERGTDRTEVLWSNRPLGNQTALFEIGGA